MQTDVVIKKKHCNYKAWQVHWLVLCFWHLNIALC